MLLVGCQLIADAKIHLDCVADRIEASVSACLDHSALTVLLDRHTCGNAVFLPDIKYHEAQNAVFSGLNLIDATHQGTELPVVAVLADKLSLRLAAAGFAAQVLTARETLLFKQY